MQQSPAALGGFTNVGIVGLGLIGASFARAIKENTPCRVLAHDRDETVLSRALSDGVADDVLDKGNVGTLDLLLIALYPAACVEFTRAHVDAIPKNCIVIDCCGVKGAVAPGMQRLADEYGFTYIGGHPMAGREKSGYDASQGTLYQNASMIVTGMPEELEERLFAFFHALGFSRLQKSTPEEHDRIIAYTSQLAHVLSSAYVKSPAALTHTGFSAGSFRDMTRVAYLNPTMWTELFLDNAEPLCDEIDGLCERLKTYSDAIRNGRREELFALLKEGRDRKEFLEEREK